MSLKFGLHTRPVSISMEGLLALWQFGERAGFDWISVFDHFYGGSPRGKSDPTFECLTTMAALAAATSRVRIGCMAACMLYRHPSILAKAAVTIDHISGGRAEFGLGAGWMEEEFVDFGYTFPPIGQRLSQLEEGIQILRSLFCDEQTSFQGKYYQLDNAVCAPKPIQTSLPLWIGGLGEKRTLRIAARHADGWNVHDIGPALFAHKNTVLNQWCALEGRDPATLRRSINLGFQMGADEHSAEKKKAALVALLPEIRREGELMGGPQEVIERIGSYQEAGVEQINIGLPPPVDWEALQAFTEEVMPRFRT